MTIKRRDDDGSQSIGKLPSLKQLERDLVHYTICVYTTPARAFSRTQERKSWKYIFIFYFLRDRWAIFSSYSSLLATQQAFSCQKSSQIVIFFFIRQMRRDKFRPNQTRTDQFIRSNLSWIYTFSQIKRKEDVQDLESYATDAPYFQFRVSDSSYSILYIFQLCTVSSGLSPR